MSQKLMIPHLGTILILSEDWSFKLYFEDRNQTMLEAFGGKKGWFYGIDDWTGVNDLDPADFPDGIPQIERDRAMTEEELERAYDSYRATNSDDTFYIPVTLKKGTQLKVDRIYIRRGAEAFDSITFRTTKIGPEKRFTNRRFWVKINDANKIVADFI